MNEIQRLIDTRKSNVVRVPAGEYEGDIVIPPRCAVVFEEGTHLKGSVTLHSGSVFNGGGTYQWNPAAGQR